MDEGKIVLFEKGIRHCSEASGSRLSDAVSGNLTLTSGSVRFEWLEGLLKKTPRTLEIPFSSIQIYDGLARVWVSKPDQIGGDYPLTIATMTHEETFLFPPNKKKQIGQWYEALQGALTGTKVEFDARDMGGLQIGSMLKNAMSAAKPIASGIADAASPIIDAAAPLASVAANVAADRHPIATSVVGAGLEMHRQTQSREAEQRLQVSNDVSFEESNTTEMPCSDANVSLDQQIETVKKLKELLDAGVLTQEEFDAKKKEAMGL